MTDAKPTSVTSLRARYRAAMASLTDEQVWAVAHFFSAHCMATHTGAGANMRLSRALDFESSSAAAASPNPIDAAIAVLRSSVAG